MKVETAIWFLKDFGARTMNCEFIQAIDTVVKDYETLKMENMLLKADKEVQDERVS